MNPLHWLTLLAFAVPVSPPTPGWVELPLPVYDQLVERANRPTPPSEARVFSERQELRIGRAAARLTATYELDFSGPHPPGLAFATVAAAIEQVTIEPPNAVVGRDSENRLLVTPLGPGRVTLQLQGHLSLGDPADQDLVVNLPPAVASISVVALLLPADVGWTLAGATIDSETSLGGDRWVELIRPLGSAAPLELRGRAQIHEVVSAYVRGVSVTLIEPGPDALQRTDVVLYEVQRGALGEMALRLPAGYEPDPLVTTDEGTLGYDLEADRLVVSRQQRLVGRGHLLLTSRAPWPTGDTLALPALEPAVEVRSRFLGVTASVAAEWAPEPAGAWTRVDREDLPPALREAVQGLALAAVWRLNQGASTTGLALAVTRLPAVDLASGILAARHSVTVATIEGSLVHRDVFEIDAGPAALEVELAPGMEFWSAKVNTEAIRPVVAAGVQRIPLPPGRGRRHTVELVVAETRALPAGKSKEHLKLQLPVVRGSVLRHEWRLMLPENRDYRLVDGELRAVPPKPPASPMAETVEVVTKRRTGLATAVSQQELDQVPTARDPWVILQNVPGVQLDRVNVGGNESRQQSTFLGPLPVLAKVPETGKAIQLSGALPPPVVTVTIESRPLKKGRR
jgi:hypothetical protein